MNASQRAVDALGRHQDAASQIEATRPKVLLQECDDGLRRRDGSVLVEQHYIVHIGDG